MILCGSKIVSNEFPEYSIHITFFEVIGRLSCIKLQTKLILAFTLICCITVTLLQHVRIGQ